MATLSFTVLRQMIQHPIAALGIIQSEGDWAWARAAGAEA